METFIIQLYEVPGTLFISLRPLLILLASNLNLPPSPMPGSQPSAPYFPRTIGILTLDKSLPSTFVLGCCGQTLRVSTRKRFKTLAIFGTFRGVLMLRKMALKMNDRSIIPSSMEVLLVTHTSPMIICLRYTLRCFPVPSVTPVSPHFLALSSTLEPPGHL